MLRAAREAKTRTSWTEPDAEFEQALKRFVSAVLQPGEEAPFLQDVARLVGRLATNAHWTALSRLLIHATAPGVTDIYRGDELWSLLLVDPDNRRAVEWERRCRLLDEIDRNGGLEDKGQASGALDPTSDATKLFVASRLLRARRQRADLFASGAYQPVRAVGEAARHVFAFMRSNGNDRALVVAPRLLHCASENQRTSSAAWGNTSIELPGDARGRRWTAVLSNAIIDAGSRESLDLGELFRHAPLALMLTA
jgi:(1->4)-alpha-D-glucan 1-alpha-D-glucosylmutase